MLVAAGPSKAGSHLNLRRAAARLASAALVVTLLATAAATAAPSFFGSVALGPAPGPYSSYSNLDVVVSNSGDATAVWAEGCTASYVFHAAGSAGWTSSADL